MTLKIVHLSTWDIEGGAARAAYRQHRALLEAGIDSQMLVRFKDSTDDRVHTFYPSTNLFHRVKRVTSRYYFKFWRNTFRNQSINNQISGILNDPRSEILTELDNSYFQGDIINVHKVEDFVDLFSLFNFLPKNIPIVVTLHDLGFMTGGCDYPYQCKQFEKSCGKCPILVSNNINDPSARIHRWKQQAYKQRIRDRLVFVANSHWTLEQAKSSSLLSPYPSRTIHYGLDTKIYNPQKRQIAREALGLPQDKPILLFSAHNVADERKGGRYIIEVLKTLHISHAPLIVTFGRGKFPVDNYQSFHFGRIDNEKFQSLIYQAADVFLMPSIEEAFGQTALESVACGTVVAGFSSGGITDIVINGLNGTLVHTADASLLRNAIVDLLDNESLRQHWIVKAEDWVNERFSYRVNANQYINLYRELLK